MPPKTRKRPRLNSLLVKLVIFDLDQTLVDVMPYQDLAISRAFKEVFGRPARFSEIDFAGKPFPVLLRELGRKKGISKRDISREESRLSRLYQSAFPGILPKRIKPLPGVADALRELNMSGVRCAVFTGGRSSVARAILSRAGILLYLHPIASSDQASTKIGMAKWVMRELRKHRVRIRRKDVVVVGDSVHEVAVARKLGARSVAVATGPQSRARLKKAKPDFLFNDLSKKGALEALL